MAAALYRTCVINMCLCFLSVQCRSAALQQAGRESGALAGDEPASRQEEDAEAAQL